MSSMTQAIDRIVSHYSTMSNITTILDERMLDWMIHNRNHDDWHGVPLSELKDKLTPEEVLRIQSTSAAPRLDLEQIRSITAQYPYLIPQEICTLYQRGNGCFPLHLDLDQNSDSLDHYTRFPYEWEGSFYDLERGMAEYQLQSQDNTLYDPHWFPFYGDEVYTMVWVGHETQQDISPVIRFCWEDDPDSFVIEWPSFTNMFLAYTEIQIRGLKGLSPSEEAEIRTIEASYGRTQDSCFWG